MTEKTFEGGFGAFLDVFSTGNDNRRASQRLSAFYRANDLADEIWAEMERTGLTEAEVHQRDLVAGAEERLLRLDPSFHSRVDEAFFARLEHAGSILLTAQQRGAFVAAIASAPDPVAPARFVETYRKRASLCTVLLENIENRPVAGLDFFRLRKDLVALAADCQSQIEKLEPFTGKRGRAKAVAPESVLRGMFVVFGLANGDFSIKDLNDGNFEGAFVEFLKVAWEAVPSCYCTKSPQEFVRKAVKMNRKWKKAGGGFP